MVHRCVTGSLSPCTVFVFKGQRLALFSDISEIIIQTHGSSHEPCFVALMWPKTRTMSPFTSVGHTSAAPAVCKSSRSFLAARFAWNWQLLLNQTLREHCERPSARVWVHRDLGICLRETKKWLLSNKLWVFRFASYSFQILLKLTRGKIPQSWQCPKWNVSTSSPMSQLTVILSDLFSLPSQLRNQLTSLSRRSTATRNFGVLTLMALGFMSSIWPPTKFTTGHCQMAHRLDIGINPAWQFILRWH